MTRGRNENPKIFLISTDFNIGLENNKYENRWKQSLKNILMELNSENFVCSIENQNRKYKQHAYGT